MYYNPSEQDIRHAINNATYILTTLFQHKPVPFEVKALRETMEERLHSHKYKALR